MKLRKLRADEVVFELSTEPEEMQVENNYMCTDDIERDKAAEREIYQRLAHGDELAWCMISVEAKWQGYVGRDTLGGCSFAPGSQLKDVQELATAHAMEVEALRVLQAKLESEFEKLQKLI